jgi:hypothetical protein
MSQLERFKALLDEMGIDYAIRPRPDAITFLVLNASVGDYAVFGFLFDSQGALLESGLYEDAPTA